MPPKDQSEENPYFGYPNFLEFYQHNSKPGYGYDGMFQEQVWKRIFATLKRTNAHTDSAEFISKNPGKNFKPIWYFQIPETRVLIPPDLLSAVDQSGAGIKSKSKGE